MERTTPDTAAAYAEYTKMTEGTLEYNQALGAFLSLLFPDGKPPISQKPASNPSVNLLATHQTAEESARMKSSKRP
jgi:hypothetical protein